MMRTFYSLLFLVALVSALGCLPRTTITKNPGARDNGIRYYRPKPYLMIKPLVDGDGIPQTGFVTIDTVMLPDFSEEYSIHVRSGLGVNETEIKLDDGWNLTAINTKVDSQFDDSIKATGELLKAIPSGTLRASAPGMTSATVRATNVPIGLYEAVISKDPNCTKRMYGFRYVGFLPFSPCPIETGGIECQSCTDGQLYGLVYENDAMVFRPLLDLAGHIEIEKEAVAAARAKAVAPGK